jgi:hypothetical protein
MVSPQCEQICLRQLYFYVTISNPNGVYPCSQSGLVLEPSLAGLTTPPSPPPRSIRGALKRLLHTFFGHPGSQVYWGTASEGATCACGIHWTIADMQM